MRRIIIIVNCVLLLCLSINVKAQVDPHFTQYHMYPLWLNPALTGAMDGDYRVNANYRNQWAGISAFNTVGISGDMTTDKNINIGANILNQTAGDLGYNYFNGYVSAAYTGVKFGKNGENHVTFGLQLGLMDRRIDPSKANWGDPYTLETLSNTSNSYFDAGAGVLYYNSSETSKYNWYGGFSVGHINKPQDQLAKTSNSTGTVPMRVTFHGGVRINVADNFNLVPNALWMTQGQADEKMLGLYGEMKANETTDFLFGANYRFKDALSPFVGVFYNSFTFGLSYDVNVSDLGKYASGKANSFELSMSYIIKKKRNFDPGYFKCPRI